MHFIESKQYFAHPEFAKEASRIRVETPETDQMILLVPNQVNEIIKQEAFYSRTQVSEMPSKLALYGSTILSFLDKGTYMDFECEGPARNNGQSYGGFRRFPFAYPKIDEAEKIDQAVRTIQKFSDGEVEVLLDPLASSLVKIQFERNGLSPEINFMSMAGVVNLVGTNERLGRQLSIYKEEMLLN